MSVIDSEQSQSQSEKPMDNSEFRKDINDRIHYMAIGADINNRIVDRLMCKLVDINLVISKNVLDDETQEEIQKILLAEEYPTLTQKLAKMRESAPERAVDSVNPLKLVPSGKDDVVN